MTQTEFVDPTTLGSDDFWSQVEEAAKGAGGTGTICKVLVKFGWKVFYKGDDPENPIPQDQTFWPYDLVANDREATKKNSAAAKALASKYIVEHGIEKGPYLMLMVRMYKNSVKGKEVSWKDDQMKFIFPSSMFFNSVLATDLKALPMFKGWGEYWCRVKWVHDPDPKNAKEQDKKDRQGNVIINEFTGETEKETVGPLLPTIVEIFENEAAALEAAGPETPGDGNVPSAVAGDDGWPEGYEDPATRDMIVAEVKSELAKNVAVAQVAGAYGLPVALVIKIKNS